ncbi:YggS family pyridoxal phosphate-dependent enzyme [Haloimpatiens lingqiaonensis]|uniref:YggS family pyridoxal phosphate-dependent enzyme n=1 Tax=Haloimpatiens lingqiaonensis TaxID=1380675 RepID=UPI0010FD6190|nr:YggS family pyridoxal phosphate-dependent enzyme [Haloimpatiens lingqiaonensis]
MSIEENVQQILKELKEDVKLIAVSKTRTVEEMEQAYKIGIRDFGENKVQELVDKYDKFHKDVHWHLLGHLQTNKVKYIVGKVHLIHSLDSIKLLEEIEKRFKAKDAIANVLIQINIGKEESKTGIYLNELEEIMNKCEQCTNVKVKGLMCIIPKGTEEENRKYFREMNDIFQELKGKNYKNISMNILSMGMSGDYKIALEEGSNMIRVGQGIFGPRNYK